MILLNGYCRFSTMAWVLFVSLVRRKYRDDFGRNSLQGEAGTKNVAVCGEPDCCLLAVPQGRPSKSFSFKAPRIALMSGVEAAIPVGFFDIRSASHTDCASRTP